MIKTTHITNLGNSVPGLMLENSIKRFIASHETFEGAKVQKDDIHIVSIFPMSNGESTYYRVNWKVS